METPDVTLAFPYKILQCCEVSSVEVEVVVDFTPWYLVIPSSATFALQIKGLRQKAIIHGNNERDEEDQLSMNWQDLVQIPHPIPACIYSDTAPRVQLGIPEKVRRGSRLALHLANTGGCPISVNAVLLGKR